MDALLQCRDASTQTNDLYDKLRAIMANTGTQRTNEYDLPNANNAAAVSTLQRQKTPLLLLRALQDT